MHTYSQLSISISFRLGECTKHRHCVLFKQAEKVLRGPRYTRSCHALAASTRLATLGETFSRSSLAIPSAIAGALIESRSNACTSHHDDVSIQLLRVRWRRHKNEKKGRTDRHSSRTQPSSHHVSQSFLLTSAGKSLAK